MSDALDQLQRVAADEVPPARHWHLRAVFEMEKERIEDWLRANVIQNLSPRNSTVKSALQAGEALPESIEGSMGLEHQEIRHADLKKKAENRVLEKNSPGRGWLRSLGVLKWLFMLAEFSLFVVQWLMGISNAAVILLGAVLAFAAFLVGWGLGMIGLDPQQGGGTKNPRIWAAILGGSVGVLGVAVLRSSGGGEGVWVVVGFTLVLALLIVLFEALHVHGKATYEENRRQFFQVQQWLAKDQHVRDFESGLWWKTYERFVTEVAQERDLIPPEFEKESSTDSPHWRKAGGKENVSA